MEFYLQAGEYVRRQKFMKTLFSFLWSYFLSEVGWNVDREEVGGENRKHGKAAQERVERNRFGKQNDCLAPGRPLKISDHEFKVGLAYGLSFVWILLAIQMHGSKILEDS